MHYDPTKIIPKRDWVLVLGDERKSVLASGIILPTETGIEKVTEGAGTVIRVGPGVKNQSLGLIRGQRVTYRSFLKYANTIETDERWPGGDAKQYFLMSSDDIMAVMDDDVQVGVFSGRPQVRGV